MERAVKNRRVSQGRGILRRGGQWHWGIVWGLQLCKLVIFELFKLFNSSAWGRAARALSPGLG